jgi:hypothetical protein
MYVCKAVGAMCVCLFKMRAALFAAIAKHAGGSSVCTYLFFIICYISRRTGSFVVRHRFGILRSCLVD